MDQPVSRHFPIGPKITTPSSFETVHFQEAVAHVFPDPVPYLTAWDLQSRLHSERLLDRQPDTLLILEHSPVYTLGRRTRPADWGGNTAALCENGAELLHVNRGGSITFHGPGQIVLYPILKVVQYATGARQLVWLLEEVLIRVLTCWGLAGVRVAGRPGVWVLVPQLQKIGFVGVRIQRGVTLHGVALNVDLDVSPFLRIHPCGLTDCSVTSMAAVSQRPIPVDMIKQQLAQTFAAVLSSNARSPRPDMKEH
ncbi:MAG: lipoyl(octanoyl) transferase LipB [Nitrospira sp.]|nr:lipoyl(octanoyl) transferase LipB [Nitrospira sp.]